MPSFFHLSDFQAGWVIGDFEPSLLRTNAFEVCLTRHAKGETSSPHYHEESTEFNIVVSGKCRVGKQICVANDIFVYLPRDVADVEFLTDTVLVVVRDSSNPFDKHAV